MLFYSFSITKSFYNDLVMEKDILEFLENINKL